MHGNCIERIEEGYVADIGTLNWVGIIYNEVHKKATRRNEISIEVSRLCKLFIFQMKPLSPEHACSQFLTILGAMADAQTRCPARLKDQSLLQVSQY
jgi:hypothetical protein